MTLLAAWVVFPAVLAALSLGCGLLVERVAGTRLQGALLVPIGLAAIIAVAGLTTARDETAELTVPLVVVLALIGFASQPLARIRRPNWWVVGTVLGVLAAFAAPIVLTGEPTFAGYIKLDDTSTWLAMTDRVMDHGRSLAGLAPSTYEATLSNYLATGYPVGSFLPLGIGHELLRQDSAWLFAPWMAFGAAMLALALWSLVGALVRPPWKRAIVVFVASQPALLFGHYLWGGVKELASVWLIALLSAVLPTALGSDRRPAAVLPLALVGAALVGVQSLAGVAWLAPVLLAGLVVAVRSLGAVASLWRAATFAAIGVVLAIPTLAISNQFLSPLKSGGGGGVFTSQAEVGNLLGPLSRLQLFGIWPTGDFRVDPVHLATTHVLIAVLGVAALGGLLWAIVRGAWPLLLYVCATVVTCLVITSVASPWVDAKSLAIASPALLVAGLAFAMAGSEPDGVFGASRLSRAGALSIAAALAGGVLWSTALAYHDANLAPQKRLAELSRIGKRFAGEGPTLMTDYEPNGVRHFLRNIDAEGASELRRRIVPLRRGGFLPKSASADIDAFRLDGILVYRTLVLRRSPVASRPPSVYRLAWRGHYYEVWQRPVQPVSHIASHLSLGTDEQPGGRPSCESVLRLAAQAGAGGSLATVPREPADVVRLDAARLPTGWQLVGQAGAVYPRRSGRLETSVQIARTGRYGVWLGGSTRGVSEVTIDGRRVGAAKHELNNQGAYMEVGSVSLGAGSHPVTVRYVDGGLYPGSSGQRVQPFPFGPLVLALGTADRPITIVPVSRARELCGRELDWIEAIPS